MNSPETHRQTVDRSQTSLNQTYEDHDNPLNMMMQPNMADYANEERSDSFNRAFDDYVGGGSIKGPGISLLDMKTSPTSETKNLLTLQLAPQAFDNEPERKESENDDGFEFK